VEGDELREGPGVVRIGLEPGLGRLDVLVEGARDVGAATAVALEQVPDSPDAAGETDPLAVSEPPPSGPA